MFSNESEFHIADEGNFMEEETIDNLYYERKEKMSIVKIEIGSEDVNPLFTNADHKELVSSVFIQEEKFDIQATFHNEIKDEKPDIEIEEEDYLNVHSNEDNVNEEKLFIPAEIDEQQLDTDTVYQNVERDKETNYKNDLSQVSFCTKNFTRKLDKNRKKGLTCNMCDKPFLSKHFFTLHQDKHMGEYKYNDESDKVFSLEQYLKEDELEHKAGLRSSCDICNKALSTESDLQLNKVMYRGKDLNEWNMYRNVFAPKRSLHSHQCKHTGETSFAHDISTKGYQKTSQARIHKLIHSQGFPYVCDICNKGFLKKDDWLTHKSLRNICNKIFNQNHILKNHAIETKYFCNICHKAFSQKGTLKTHKMIHSKKAYKCDVCIKAFANKSNLLQHKRKHVKQTQYICVICERKFAKKRFLVNHHYVSQSCGLKMKSKY